MLRKTIGFLSLVSLVVFLLGIHTTALAQSIEFWLQPGDPYESSLRNVAASFTEETGIEVNITLVTYGEHREKLTVAVAGGSPPDVMQFERSSITEYVASYNVIEPLDRLLADFDRETLLPGPLSEATFRGQWYGMPERTDVRGLYWNESLVSAAGLDADKGPQTWEDLDLYARRLTRMVGNDIEQLGFAPWFQNWGVAGWIWAFGGEVYDAEANAPTLNTDEAIEVLNWYATYRDWLGPQGRSFAQTYGNAASAFYNDGLAMIIESTSFVGRIAQTEPDLQYMTGPVPHPPGGANGTWSGGPAMIIPSGARNPELAAKFLEYVAREEVQLRRYIEATAIPATLDGLWAAIAETDHEPTKRLFEQLPVAHGRPPMWVPIINRLTEAQNKVLDGVAPPNAALADAQQLIEADFARVFGGN